MIEQAGLRIVAQKRLRITREQAETFYAVQRQRPFFGELVDFMISGPVVVQILEGENAIAKYSSVMGATDPAKAAPAHPQSSPPAPSARIRCTARCAGYRSPGRITAVLLGQRDRWLRSRIRRRARGNGGRHLPGGCGPSDDCCGGFRAGGARQACAAAKLRSSQNRRGDVSSMLAQLSQPQFWVAVVQIIGSISFCPATTRS